MLEQTLNPRKETVFCFTARYRKAELMQTARHHWPSPQDKKKKGDPKQY